MENRDPYYADAYDVNCRQPFWRSVMCFLKHVRNKATQPMALPLMVLQLREIKIKNTQPPQSLGPLCSQEPRLQYQVNISESKQWIKKLWYVRTMEYHSAMKSVSSGP